MLGDYTYEHLLGYDLVDKLIYLNIMWESDNVHKIAKKKVLYNNIARMKIQSII
jgi:hypothetical protein